MEYTQENHYSQIVLENIKSEFNHKNYLRTNLHISSSSKEFYPIEITYRSIPCWIMKTELDILEKNNIKVDEIEVLTYIQGLLSPYGTKSNFAGSAIDGYQLHMFHKLVDKDLITVEFKSAWDWQNQKYHRLGDPNTIIEVDRYRKVTNRNLDDLNLFEKTNLVERANTLTTLVNDDLKKYHF